jgi:hypothetical protein
MSYVCMSEWMMNKYACVNEQCKWIFEIAVLRHDSGE